MNRETEKMLALFAENVQLIKQEFIWHNAMTKRLAALFYAQADKQVDCGAMRRCHDLVKQNAGVFSYIRGNMALTIDALLSLSDSPEELLGETLNVYCLLKAARFNASDYLVVAAYLIAERASTEQYLNVISRARTFYDGMKKYHRFYTSHDDFIYSAMLGLSDLDPQSSADGIERLYQRLKDDFWDKNSVQGLAEVLILGGESIDVSQRIRTLRSSLRERKLRLDKSYTLPMLGVLALLPVDAETIGSDIIEARNYLRTQKGFGSISVTTQEILLYSAAIVASEYAGNIKDGITTATISTSITNIIIAQQAAMIAAASAHATATTAVSSQ